MKVGDLVKVSINDIDKNDELIPVGTCGLIIEEAAFRSSATPPNKVFKVKLLGRDDCNYYYASNLGVINEGR
jgi:hypothetical protein